MMTYSRSSTTHEDGSFWEYEYDGRYRLTNAVRKNASETIEASYAYTYDAGDNLLTKIEPFEDDFNDGNYTGWTVTSGTWTASNNYIEPTHATSTNVIRKGHTDADNEIVLRYRINDTSSNSAKASVHCRHVDGSNLIAVEIQPDRMRLVENVSGTGTVQDLNTSATSSEDVWYNLRIEADGGDVTVWRWADGDLATEVLAMTGATIDTTSTCLISVLPAYDYDFDDIRILSGDLSNTTAFAVNNANELTSVTDYNGSTTFAFDDWGRMTGKARGSYEATYAYRYGQMLRSVTSDFPSEGNVTYEYGADFKRRSRSAGGILTNYRWAFGFRPVSEENDQGQLERTFLNNKLAEIHGSNPSSGTYHFLHRDNLRTIRSKRDSSKTRIFSFEADPFGLEFMRNGESPTFTYTSHSDESNFYYTPYRIYNPEIARWLTRDPLGLIAGTNLYSYVHNSPISFFDPLGLDRMCFDGKDVTHYDDDGNLLGTYPATSGVGTTNDTSAKNEGPIPEGTYTLKPDQCSKRSPLVRFFNWCVGIDWGRWRVPLHPDEGTDTKGRGGFYLHGGNEPGSAGCIDIGSADSDLFPDLKEHDGDVTVEVDYPDEEPSENTGNQSDKSGSKKSKGK